MTKMFVVAKLTASPEWTVLRWSESCFYYVPYAKFDSKFNADHTATILNETAR